jgi:opacity protein-like surface antigen
MLRIAALSGDALFRRTTFVHGKVAVSDVGGLKARLQRGTSLMGNRVGMTFLLGGSALLGTTLALTLIGSSSADAADLPVYLKAPPPAAFDWTGVYFGGHVGYGWGGNKFYDIFPAPDGEVDADKRNSGFLGGIQAGYRHQFGRFVVGIQGDYSWSGISSNFNCFTFGNQVCNANAQWFSTLTGSFGGLITPQALLYIKGGGAAIRDQYSDVALSNASRGLNGNFVNSAPGVPFEADQTRLGWTVGAGFEYMLTRNWSVFGEYDYMNFGSRSVPFVGEAPNAAFPELVKQYDVELVKLGFNYKLDWGALADANDPAPHAAGIFKAPSGAAGSSAEQLYHVLPFTGIDVTSRNSVDGWVGALYAPTTDLDSYGPRIYVLGGSGYYKYNSTQTGAPIKGVYETGDVLGGWGLEGHNYSVNLLAGLNVENHSLSQADPDNPVDGARVGAKVRADGWINPTAQTLIYEEGEYSTVFNSYYTSAKVGYDIFGNTGVFIGPEVTAMGNDRYDQGRVGAHVTQLKFGKIQMDISGGYLHDTTVGNGGYGKVEFNTQF